VLHICYRKSEDLDSFTYSNSFYKKEIINQTYEQIDLLLNGVKVTFFNAVWSSLKPKKVEVFNLAIVE